MAEQLATIERIDKVEKHPNADKLSLVSIGAYRCIVSLDEYKEGDLCILVRPDSVLPDQEWAIPYKKFVKGRIKATKIRDVWSFGLVIKPTDVGIHILHPEYEVGMDVTDFLGITKFVNLEIENKLDVRRAGLPWNIPKSDEDTWRSYKFLEQKIGQITDISEKIDGQSICFYFKDGDFGVCSRSNDYKIEVQNVFTAHLQRYSIQEKLTKFCIDNKVNLAIRGESYGGNKIQNFKHNPYSKLPFGVMLYGVWNIDEMRYCKKGDKYYIFDIAHNFGIPTVPVIEQDVILSYDLINKYEKGLEKINDRYFEGVVINGVDFSFKIINFHYDQLK